MTRKTWPFMATIALALGCGSGVPQGEAPQEPAVDEGPAVDDTVSPKPLAEADSPSMKTSAKADEVPPKPPAKADEVSPKPPAKADGTSTKTKADKEALDLFRDLGGDDPDVARVAAGKLAELRRESYVRACAEQVPYLRAALGSDDPAVLATAADLAVIHDGLEPLLVGLLDHADRQVRFEAAETLWLERYAPAAPAMARLLLDPDGMVGYQATRFFEEVDKQALAPYEDDLHAVFAAEMRSGDFARQKKMLYVIQITGFESSVPLVTPLLNPANPAAWREAASTLGMMKQPSAIGALCRLLEDQRIRPGYDLKVLTVALARIDESWGTNKAAPRWLRKLAALTAEYVELYRASRKNVYLREMLGACVAAMPETPVSPEVAAILGIEAGEYELDGIGVPAEGVAVDVAVLSAEGVKELEAADARAREAGGTEQEARAVHRKLAAIAAKLRRELKKVKLPRREEIVGNYVPEFVREQAESFPYCEKASQ